MTPRPANQSYIAQPPGPLGSGSGPSLGEHLRRIVYGFVGLVIQVFIPYNPRPESPLDPPLSSGDLDEKVVDQCIRIFDQAESTRKYLEEKARAVFTMVAFLVPLLIGVFIFLFGKTNAASGARNAAIALAAIAGLFLLLGFVSIVRAVAVQTREELFLGSVLENSDFRKYDKTFYARGLLYCASINTAMNGHIAQFVKGAHVLTALAVVLSGVAAIPLTRVLANTPEPVAQAKIIGPVAVSSTQMEAMRDDIAQIEIELQKLANHARADDDILQLKVDISRLKLRLRNSVSCGQDTRPPLIASKCKFEQGGAAGRNSGECNCK